LNDIVSNNLLVIRHGILSKKENMKRLEEALRTWIPCGDANVDNETYRWREPVLWNGIELARSIVKRFREHENIERIFLIGHSQGGLVCRIATAAICAPQQLDEALVRQDYVETEYLRLARGRLSGLLVPNRLVQRCADRIKVVVTMAAPNAGAFTHGQLAVMGRAALVVTKKVLGASGFKNLHELTTDRLFRILQHVRVERVKYLSISGSKINRYSSVNHGDLSSIPGLDRLGTYLEKPNDGLVEDVSVDLREAPLLCEIADLDQQYRHVRCYTDCLDIAHTTIHSRHEVFEILEKAFEDWGFLTT
jgi:hypothetical protein